MRRLFMTLVTLTILLSGCEGDGVDDVIVLLPSYVTAYQESVISCRSEDGERIWISGYGDRRDIYAYNSEDDDRRLKYRQLCEKHSDISYNKLYRTYFVYTTPTCYMANDIVSVDVVSDSDWDAEHLAGTSLGDIAMFYSLSPYRYIQSGYKKVYDWDNSVLFDEFDYIFPYTLGVYKTGKVKNSRFLYPVKKLISDLMPEDLILLGVFDVRNNSIARIIFTNTPTLSRIHNVTVNIELNDGRIFREEVYLSFD